MQASLIRIALVGDRDDVHVAHRAIPRALELAARALHVDSLHEWLHTAALGRGDYDITAYDGIWCVPATPYSDTNAALRAITHARTNGVPFLGTCGGFQHALIEYAAAVWGVENPAHAETSPSAVDPVIAPLACSLVEEAGAVRFQPGSQIAKAYGAERSVEGYHCRYGLNAKYVARLNDGPLRATAWDDEGDVRAVELDAHPFFVATLFQPERAALEDRVPPIVAAFVEACAKDGNRKALSS